MRSFVTPSTIGEEKFTKTAFLIVDLEVTEKGRRVKLTSLPKSRQFLKSIIVCPARHPNISEIRLNSSYFSIFSSIISKTALEGRDSTKSSSFGWFGFDPSHLRDTSSDIEKIEKKKKICEITSEKNETKNDTNGTLVIFI